jgi:hypothetical protein
MQMLQGISCHLMKAIKAEPVVSGMFLNPCQLLILRTTSQTPQVHRAIEQ